MNFVRYEFMCIFLKGGGHSFHKVLKKVCGQFFLKDCFKLYWWQLSPGVPYNLTSNKLVKGIAEYLLKFKTLLRSSF